MAQQDIDSSKNVDPADKTVNDFVKSLTQEQRMLIVLKAQLYGGTWEQMLDDLKNRLAGKPYIFKLANRIQDDIERIEQMSAFEAEHNVNLSDYVDLS
jgi:6-phosphogluconate dehydrogenase